MAPRAIPIQFLVASEILLVLEMQAALEILRGSETQADSAAAARRQRRVAKDTRSSSQSDRAASE